VAIRHRRRAQGVPLAGVRGGLEFLEKSVNLRKLLLSQLKIPVVTD
jgi:hypothetical protein